MHSMFQKHLKISIEVSLIQQRDVRGMPGDRKEQVERCSSPKRYFGFTSCYIIQHYPISMFQILQ